MHTTGVPKHTQFTHTGHHVHDSSHSYGAVFHPEVFARGGYGAMFHPEVFARGGITVCSKFKGGHHVVWACEAQIPRGGGGHVGFKREQMPPPPP